MFSRFIVPVARIGTALLSKADTPLYIYTTFCLSITPSVNAGLLPHLVVYIAAMNMSMLLHSFLLANNIPLYGYIFSLSAYQLIGIWVLSTFGA